VPRRTAGGCWDPAAHRDVLISIRPGRRHESAIRRPAMKAAAENVALRSPGQVGAVRHLFQTILSNSSRPRIARQVTSTGAWRRSICSCRYTWIETRKLRRCSLIFDSGVKRGGCSGAKVFWNFGPHAAMQASRRVEILLLRPRAAMDWVVIHACIYRNNGTYADKRFLCGIRRRHSNRSCA
jgi:hypothetical protein